MIWQQREMTQNEIAILNVQLQKAKNVSLSDAIKETDFEFIAFIGTLGLGFLVLIVLLFAFMVIEWLFTWDLPLTRSEFATFATWAAVLAGIWGAYQSIKEPLTYLRVRKVEIPHIEEALKAKTKHILNFQINEVKVYREPEHGMRILFLLTENDKVFCLFDYYSALSSSSKNWLRPKKKVELIKPYQGAEVEVRFLGKDIAMKRAKTLRENPRERPEPETFIDVEWQKIHLIFGT